MSTQSYTQQKIIALYDLHQAYLYKIHPLIYIFTQSFSHNVIAPEITPQYEYSCLPLFPATFTPRNTVTIIVWILAECAHVTICHNFQK